MIIVSAAIIVKSKKYLIARRAPLKHLGGFWEFPGGKIEGDETPEECLKREIKEELGIVIKVGPFFMENNHQYSENNILLKAFFCEFIAGEVILNDHDRVEWVEKSQLNNYQFAPADRPLIKALNEQS